MKKTLCLLLCAIMMLFAFTSCTDPVSIASVAADGRDILSNPENVLKTINVTYDYNEPVGRFLSEDEGMIPSWYAVQMVQYGDDDYLKMILANDISPLLKDVPFGKLVIIPEQTTYSDATIDAVLATRADIVELTKTKPEKTRPSVVSELRKVQVKAIQVDKFDDNQAKVWFAVKKNNKLYFYVLYCTRNQYGIFDTTAYRYNMEVTEKIGSSSLVDIEKSIHSTTYGDEYSVSYEYVEVNGVEQYSGRKYESSDQIRMYERAGGDKTYTYFDKNLGGAVLKADGYYEFFDVDYDLLAWNDDIGVAVMVPATDFPAFDTIPYTFNKSKIVVSAHDLQDEVLSKELLESLNFHYIDMYEKTTDVVNNEMPTESSTEGFYYTPDEAFRINMVDLADWAFDANSYLKKNH